MPNPSELTFDVMECPGGTWGVQAWNWNRTRTFGVDHHWLHRTPAEQALCVYLDKPALHGKATEEQVHRAYDALLTKHREAMESWVQEAAADLGLDEEVVWHDVTVSYLTLEVQGERAIRDLARGQGIPADMVGLNPERSTT